MTLSQEEKQERLVQLRRLADQTKSAIAYMEADMPFMPLQADTHMACLIVGDFVIVDKMNSAFAKLETVWATEHRQPNFKTT